MGAALPLLIGPSEVRQCWWCPDTRALADRVSNPAAPFPFTVRRALEDGGWGIRRILDLR
jgi:hypothetical protein